MLSYRWKFRDWFGVHLSVRLTSQFCNTCVLRRPDLLRHLLELPTTKLCVVLNIMAG